VFPFDMIRSLIKCWRHASTYIVSINELRKHLGMSLWFRTVLSFAGELQLAKRGCQEWLLLIH
jgi:hypothetical protein